MKRVGVYVALGDVMMNFAMIILLFATPRDKDSQGRGYDDWSWASNRDERHITHFYKEGEDWKVGIYSTDYAGFHVLCLDGGLDFLFGEDVNITIYDDAGLDAWLLSIHDNEQVTIYEVDPDCKRWVEQGAHLLNAKGEYVWMDKPPNAFSDWWEKGAWRGESDNSSDGEVPNDQK